MDTSPKYFRNINKNNWNVLSTQRDRHCPKGSCVLTIESRQLDDEVYTIINPAHVK